MPDSNKPIHIRELQWLAQFYESHGQKKEAQKIQKELAALQARLTENVLEMFNRDEEKQA